MKRCRVYLFEEHGLYQYKSLLLNKKKSPRTGYCFRKTHFSLVHKQFSSRNSYISKSTVIEQWTCYERKSICSKPSFHHCMKIRSPDNIKLMWNRPWVATSYATFNKMYIFHIAGQKLNCFTLGGTKHPWCHSMKEVIAGQD